MEILTPGHKYIAANFEDPTQGQTIQFIEKELRHDASETTTAISADKTSAELAGTLVTVNDGTTNEELIIILVDRLSFLNKKFPCKENACAITKLEEALHWLESRTKNRVKRGVYGTNNA